MTPLLFSFWWFDIKTTHILISLGFFISSWVLTRTVHEKKLSLSFLTDHLILFSLSTLFIGRIGAVWFIFPAISEKMLSASSLYEKSLIFIRSFFSFWHEGIDVFWAVGGFLFIFLLICTIKNEHPLSWLDAFSIPIVIFLIFYSLGAFFAGWNYGKPVNDSYIFAVSYPDNNEVQYSGSIHPVQLYGSFLFFLLLIYSVRIWRKKIREKWPSGIFGGILLSSLFFILSFLEFFRGSPVYKVFEILPFPSLIFFGIGFSIIIFMIAKGHFHIISQLKKIISQ